MTRVLVASDKFKGSLSAAEVAAALSAGITAADSSWVVHAVPIADGGDGTVAAALAAGWSPVSVPTVGATGQPHTTQYAVRGSSALIELASAAELDAAAARSRFSRIELLAPLCCEGLNLHRTSPAGGGAPAPRGGMASACRGA